MTSESVVRTGAMLAVLLIASAMSARVGIADSEAGIAAVWQPQILRFEYRADRSLYTCRSLQTKVERVLRHVGVRARFRRFYCGELSRLVTAEIVLAMPIEATDENRRRLTDFNSSEILVARLRGQRLPTAADLEVFPAAWETVSLAGMQFSNGDCQLLWQLRKQVMSKLSVRIVSDNLRQCSTSGGGAPRLVVQALVAEAAARSADTR
ncbi:MAG TPA: hypothetical protein VH814_16255 [Steroidobacteraceae bacterium]|jgi:hypothetical protein